MAWPQLSQEQQENVQQADRWVRDFLKTLGNKDLDLKIQWFNDNVAPAIALMDVGEDIPKSDSLAGSVTLTHEQLTALKNWIASISTDIETNKSLLVKAIGVNA
jgi:hypothetical protein